MPRRYYRTRSAGSTPSRSVSGKYYKRKSKSTFSYYKKRSSKQQAYQIAKLDKRIDAVYRNLGGTVERIERTNPYLLSWGTSTPTGTVKNQHFEVTMQPTGQTPNEILYRGCYVLVNANFVAPPIMYSATTTTTPIVWYRIIAIQYKQAGEDYTMQDFLKDVTISSAIFDPLLEDVGTKARILKDIRFRLDANHPEKHLRLRFNRRFRIKQASGINGCQKNTIHMFAISWNQGAETGNIATWGSQCAVDCTFKPYNYIIYDKHMNCIFLTTIYT